MNTSERLIKFVSESKLFDGEPVNDYVDKGYFGPVNPALIREIPAEGDEQEDGTLFLGLKILDHLPNGADFIAEIGLADAVALEHPEQAAINIMNILLKRIAVDLCDAEDMLPGPEGAQPYIAKRIVGKVAYRFLDPGDGEPTLTIKLRVTASRIAA